MAIIGAPLFVEKTSYCGRHQDSSAAREPKEDQSQERVTKTIGAGREFLREIKIGSRRFYGP